MTLNEVREVLNGIWSVSSLCMIVLLTIFITVWRTGQHTWEWRWRKTGWWRDSGIQVAGALLILILGHWLRATPQWLQFIVLNNNSSAYPTAYWWATVTFVPATVLAVTGKILCVWSISPGEWNWHIATVVLLLSCTLPFFVFWFI